MSSQSADNAARAAGMQLAQMCAPAFVALSFDLSAEQRVEFVRAFFVCVLGMAENSIGYTGSREVAAFLQTLAPVGPVGPMQ
ncbi:MAG: hypothetical protein MUC86_13555 [Burkholderiaceae bacterium]|jgi:hypothetical protein|nr:hypothetical protein [Burkholderiaceae bacterium]